MKQLLLLIATLVLLSLVNAQGNTSSFCDRYSMALGMNNSELVSFVVTQTFNSTLNSDLIVFFNGMVPAGSVDFTDPLNAASFTHLFNGLVTFFGEALGCTDGTIAPYTGRSMKDAHAGIPINASQFDQFNGFIVEVMRGAGVVALDLESVGGVLESTRPDICTLCPPPSICDRYSKILNLTNGELVSTVVQGVFAKVLVSDLLPFFNGMVPEGSTNFTDPANDAAFTHLFNGLVSFFGEALGCTDKTIPAYSGRSMAAAHAGIPINSTQFELFNQFVLDVMEVAGVVLDDLTAVGGVLESTRPDVCTLCASTTTTTTTSSSATESTTSGPESICDRYSVALSLTNNELVSFVVNGTVYKALGSELVVFFNGEIGETDFTDPANSAAFAHLFDGLVTFFGVALGCTDGTIAPYTGRNMTEAHAHLPINATQFEQFNTFVLEILEGAGVTLEDRNAVGDILESTRPYICNQCESTTTTSETSGTNTDTTSDDSSAVALGMSFAVAAFLLA